MQHKKKTQVEGKSSMKEGNVKGGPGQYSTALPVGIEVVGRTRWQDNWQQRVGKGAKKALVNGRGNLAKFT